MPKIKPIVYFDMDDTLCDYMPALLKEMKKLMSPQETTPMIPQGDDCPAYLYQRMSLILSKEEFWTDLKPRKSAQNLLQAFGIWGFDVHILTAGPMRYPMAWSGKKKWITKYYHQEAPITITRDKSRMMGDILVDDYPKYFDAWLKRNPKGTVIYPVGPQNKDYKHKRAIPFYGSEPEDKEWYDLYKIAKRYL